MKRKLEKLDTNGSEHKTKCCKMESIISIDDRGQMVLPKDIRDSADIQAGNKFAVISWEKDGQLYCISLMRVEQLTDSLKNILLPLLRDFEGKSNNKGGQHEG